MNKSAAQTTQPAAKSLAPVQGILQRKCACGNHTIAGGECAECANKRIGIQRKLAIGASNDPLEQEADRVADQVMRMPAGGTVGIPGQRGKGLQKTCAPCAQEYALAEKEKRPVRQANLCPKCASENIKLQRKSESAVREDARIAPASVDHALAGSGRPLDPGLQQDMGQRFGYDFSQVRVHTGSAAEQSAREVNANAYTVGHDIVFGGGLAPESHAGQRLIAHELTHVIQQRGLNPCTGTTLQRRPVNPSDDPLHQPMIEEYRRAHGLPLDGRDPEKGQPAGPSDAELKYGGVLDAWIRSRNSGGTGIGGTGSGTVSTVACLPTLVNPQWDVATHPILMNFTGQRCAMQLAKQFAPTGSIFGINGMEFKGQINVPQRCPGQFYFVQFTRPSRASVGCLEGREIVECIRPGWGLDTSWPYSFGSTVDTTAQAGATVAVNTVDSPGIRNISNPALDFIRHCIADEEFVTYLVFEDTAHNLTSLGWMNWKWSARALRGNGQCPPSSSQPDCTGWTLTGTGSKLGERFAPSAIGPQPLNRSASPVSMLSSACPSSACPATAPSTHIPPSSQGAGAATSPQRR